MDRTAMKAIVRAGHRQSWDQETVCEIAYLAYQLGCCADDGSIRASDKAEEATLKLLKLGVDTAKLDSRYQ